MKKVEAREALVNGNFKWGKEIKGWGKEREKVVYYACEMRLKKRALHMKEARNRDQLKGSESSIFEDYSTISMASLCRAIRVRAVAFVFYCVCVFHCLKFV